MRSRPIVTQGITLAAVAVYLLSRVSGEQASIDWAYAAGIVPARLSGQMAVDTAIPAVLTPLSATMLHGSLLHLGFNMLMFFYIGRPAEAALGHWRFLLLYVIGAYAAAAAQWIVAPMSTVAVIGASGAISAVLGAYALYFGERRAVAGRWLSAEVRHVLWLAVSWIGLQLLIGLVMNGSGEGGFFGMIAIWAHIGGFIAGLIVARPLLRLGRH